VTEWDLRIYRVQEGALDTFIREWRTQVLPLRLAAGFEVLGPWKSDDGDFVWLVGHAELAAADAAYYASAERLAVAPDPARHIVAARTWRLESA
jgi:hypothetical protein